MEGVSKVVIRRHFTDPPRTTLLRREPRGHTMEPVCHLRSSVTTPDLALTEGSATVGAASRAAPEIEARILSGPLNEQRLLSAAGSLGEEQLQPFGSLKQCEADLEHRGAAVGEHDLSV